MNSTNNLTSNMTDAQYYRFQQESADAEAQAETQLYPRYGYNVGQKFETAEEWLSWKLQDIAEDIIQDVDRDETDDLADEAE